MFRSLILVICLLISFPALALTGKVVSVTDGDTIRILDETNTQYRIRFASIDAPEKKQDFGVQAKQRLSDLIYGKVVNVDVDAVDRYGRSVGVVFYGDININEEMIRSGLAWVYVDYLNKRDNYYIKIQEQAKKNKIGLWNQSDPMAPWEFRKISKTR